MRYDYLIVGSGLFGATFAHLATKAGKKCLVIDKRPYLGGNIYCEQVEGINVHKYGAHIFHTNSKRVWDFVNGIVEFNRYTNSPVANYEGRLYNLPFNMNTFYQMWGVLTPEEAKAKIDEQKAEALVKMQADGATEPRNLEEQALLLVGKDIYERLIKGYTEKQWGRKCTDLPAFIIKRLPLRFVFDNNYFNDRYQGIPMGGYNKLIEGLLQGVDTITGLDFFTPLRELPQDVRRRLENTAGDFVLQRGLREEWQSLAHQLVFTGKIDEFFDYRYGKLEYRTVSFEQETLDRSNYQGNAVVNYTAPDIPYTRIIEHKHFETFGADVDQNPRTVISKEYSTEWKPGMEPYYPVNDEKNNTLYRKYKQLANEYNASLQSSPTTPTSSPSTELPSAGVTSPFAEERRDRLILGGRLAEYQYYDMAPIIEKVLRMFS